MAQTLNPHAVAEAVEKNSRLGKLVRGMPDRLTKCKKNKYGSRGRASLGGNSEAL